MASSAPTAKGHIKSIRREGTDLYVDIEVQSASVGSFNLIFKVPGPISSVPEAARKALFALGGEIAHGFDLPGSLG